MKTTIARFRITFLLFFLTLPIANLNAQMGELTGVKGLAATLPFDGYVLLGQRLSEGLFIGGPEAAIGAVVGTFVPDIEGRKEHDAIAVDAPFECSGSVLDQLDRFRVVCQHQAGCFFEI